MSINLKIKYIYGNILEDHENLKDSQIHQVADQIVHEHLAKLDKSGGIVIDQQFVINVLKKDGAHFFQDSMRYFDRKKQAFMQLSSAFTLTITSSREETEILLWLKGLNKHNKNKLKKLSEKIKKLEKAVDSLKNALVHHQTSVECLTARESIPLPDAKFDEPIPISLTKSKSLAHHRNHSVIPAMGSSTHRKNLSITEALDLDMLSSNLRGRLEQQKIDIAIMYAEPLIKKDEGQIISLPDAVDYEEECSKIYEVLDSKQMKIDLIIEIATRANLISVLSKKPRILHIICHGEYDRKKKQFYLCFENNEGELDPFYASDLKEIMDQLRPEIQVVFVNACHSEQVARVFADAGVPCVIAVQSQLQIADIVARNFAQKFYRYLFDGETIGQAFYNSKLSIQSPGARSCCCAHAHKSNCKWYQMAVIEGYYKAHLYHDPTCTDCPKKADHKHSMECDWAGQFVYNFSLKDTDGDDKWYNFDEEIINTCCCSPDLPHNETMKFMKIPEHSNEFDNRVLFADQELGHIVNRKPYSVLEQVFPVKRLIGRNRAMYDLFQVLKSKQKFVELYGPEGIGKTSLVKQLANYFYARDLFRFKIAIVDMARLDSIQFFLPELYREIDFAFDRQAFCQALKHKDALFILESCDSVLENNKGEFVEILKNIGEMTKNVKFLIVTKNKQELGLGETILALENLPRVDAAKLLLISTAIENIPTNLRNIEELKESELFKEFDSFSPQAIWWFSQKLNQREPFSKVQNELLETLKLGQERTTQINTAIGNALEAIKNDNEEGFTLLGMICLFPSGLSFDDLIQLANLKFIPSDWDALLQKMLNSKDASAKLMKPAFPESDHGGKKTTQPPSRNQLLEEEETKSADKVTSKAELWVDEIDSEKIKPGNYYWLTIQKDTVRNGLFFQPSQSVHSYLKRSLRTSLTKQILDKFEYLTILSLSLISGAKNNFHYNERLLENSLVSEHGVWKMRDENYIYQKYRDSSREMSYLEKLEDQSFKDLKQVFWSHDSNFLSLLEVELINDLLSQEENRSRVLDLVEILWLAVPTCYKIFSNRSSSAITLGSIVLGRVHELTVKDQRLVNLSLRLHLFLNALYIYHDKDAQTTLNAINYKNENLQKTLKDVTDEGMRDGFRFSLEFARAFFFYKLKRGRYSGSVEVAAKMQGEGRYHNVVKILKDICEPILKPLDNSYDVERAQVTILACKTIISAKRGNIEPKFKEKLKTSIESLSQCNCKRLEMQANYLFAKIQLHLYRQRDKNQLSNETMKEIQELNEMRKIYLKKNALSLVQLVNDAHYESKIKRLVNEINTEIRQSFFNVILLMRASPIQVERGSSEAGSSTEISDPSMSITSVEEVRTTVPTFFRTDLMQSISLTKKALHLKFEVLTKANLRDTTKFGCRMMLLQSDMSSPHGIVVESPEGKPEVVTYDELRDLLPKNHHTSMQSELQSLNVSMQALDNPQPIKKEKQADLGDKGVDLCIVGTKNDMKTALFLSREMKIPFVITFSFKRESPRSANQKEMQKPEINSFRRKLYEDECVEKFCGYFFNDLIDGCTVQQAFDNAKKGMIECVSFSFCNSNDEMVIETLGEGPILLPNSDSLPHDHVFFGVDNFVLQGGKAEEISSVRFPTNVHKSLVPFTGRLREMDQIMKKLLKPKDNIVLLTGEPGTGKTRFILEVAYFMQVRNFFPDGVFYFPLRKYKKKSFYEMIKETINLEAFGSKLEFNLKNLFRNKKMLLVFDDIDIFFENDIEFPWPVFSMLQKNNISTVLIQKHSVLKMVDKQQPKKVTDLHKKINEELVKERVKLDRFSDFELAHVLASLVEQRPEFDLSPMEVQNQSWIRTAKGNPSKLIKSLTEGKVSWKSYTLKMNPVYAEFINLKLEGRMRTSKVPHWNGAEDDPSSGVILTFSRHCSHYSVAVKCAIPSQKREQGQPLLSARDMPSAAGINLAESTPVATDEPESEYERKGKVQVPPLNLKRAAKRTRTKEAFQFRLAAVHLIENQVLKDSNDLNVNTSIPLKNQPAMNPMNLDLRFNLSKEKTSEGNYLTPSMNNSPNRNATDVNFSGATKVGNHNSDEEDDDYEHLERRIRMRGCRKRTWRKTNILLADQEFENKLNILRQKIEAGGGLPVEENVENVENEADEVVPRIIQRHKRHKRLETIQQANEGQENDSGGFSLNDVETPENQSFCSDNSIPDPNVAEKFDKFESTTPFMRPIKTNALRRVEEMHAIQQSRSPKDAKEVKIISPMQSATHSTATTATTTNIQTNIQSTGTPDRTTQPTTEKANLPERPTQTASTGFTGGKPTIPQLGKRVITFVKSPTHRVSPSVGSLQFGGGSMTERGEVKPVRITSPVHFQGPRRFGGGSQTNGEALNNYGLPSYNTQSNSVMFQPNSPVHQLNGSICQSNGGMIQPNAGGMNHSSSSTMLANSVGYQSSQQITQTKSSNSQPKEPTKLSYSQLKSPTEFNQMAPKLNSMLQPTVSKHTTATAKKDTPNDNSSSKKTEDIRKLLLDGEKSDNGVGSPMMGMLGMRKIDRKQHP